MVSNGQKPSTEPVVSSSLPFSRPIALQELSSNSFQYVTVQILAQQIAYLFSDKIFTYSPDSFALDIAVKQWSKEQQRNLHGFVPGVEVMQTRIGAGAIALGYVFSPDFDLEKRHIPQSIIASSGSLVSLRESLSQLSLLYALANPFVAHIAAVDYAADIGLVSDYTSAFEIADDLGLGLVSSTSAKDAQHMALLATILSNVLPTIHTYDGISSRDTVMAHTLLDQVELNTVYERVVKQLGGTASKHSDNAGKALRVLKALNGALATDYQAFEYHGHAKAEQVLVVFGSVEATLATRIVEELSKSGVKAGVVNVRLYRPFIEEEFLRVLPKSTRKVTVLGQVEDDLRVAENDVHSRLFQDVLTSLTFSSLGGKQVAATDLKYSRQQDWTHEKFVSVFEQITEVQVDSERLLTPDPRLTQISFWTLDESAVTKSLPAFERLAANFPNGTIHARHQHDNLVQGGVSRSDLTISSNNADLLAPFHAQVIFVGSEKILKEFDIVTKIRNGGTLILPLSGVKDEDLEKKLPEVVRNLIKTENIKLVLLDVPSSPTVSGNSQHEATLVWLAVMQALEAQSIDTGAKRRAGLELGSVDVLDTLINEVPEATRTVETPESWGTSSEEPTKEAFSDFSQTSFVPFDQTEEESGSLLQDWIIAARGAVFREAYDTKTILRPEAGVKTSVVTVKEHRRLTPMTYERNVFHIEFDLGNSGLTYAIGEALGIHAENDASEVQEFIEWYGLKADQVVQVPSRDDPSVLENRTVYQALVQNVDIFGRPPKRFYEALSEFATDENDQKNLLTLSLPEGATEFKRRAEVDTITYADIFAEFPSAHPSFEDLVRIVAPLKRREYSIASSQHVTPTSVALLIVTVGWTDTKKRDRFGLATRYLNSLKVGTPVTVSVKPSVMKLPPKSTAPIIMAGLGTGLAPFRAFVQERAYQKQVLGQEIGSVLLYLGSRHQREEYLYGEEWEAYQAAGIITLIGAAFSRDQPQKIYIQDRMRQTLDEIRQAYLREEGGFYLCGPTWPVPDVTEVLEEAVVQEGKANGAKKVDGRREIETLKDAGRFVLEVY